MEPLLLRPGEAGELLGVGRSKAYQLIACGELPAVKIGTSLRVARADLESFVDRLRGRPESGGS